jgi:hypothetical protein
MNSMNSVAYFATTKSYATVSYSQCKQKWHHSGGQASSAKMMSLGDKLTALACHPTKRVNKAEELIYLSTNIDFCAQNDYESG